MAGVKISDMADKSGGPDGTELVEITSDPSGTPVTRRVTTQLIADLYEIETHASTHENGGSDEIDVTGLSGVLADAQTPSAHASTHASGASDPIDAGDLSGTGAIGNAFDISDAITGNPHAKIEQRNATEIESYVLETSISDYSGTVGKSCVEKGVIVFNGSTTTDQLEKRDRFTGQLLDTYVPAATTGGRAVVCNNGILYIPSFDSVWEVPVDTFDSGSLITATGLKDSINRGATVGPDGDIYSLSSAGGETDKIFRSVRGSSSYTVTPYTLTGVTSPLYDIIFSPDKTAFYVVDTNIIRKFDTATRTLQASSSALTGTYLNSFVFGFVGDNVCVALSGNLYLLHPDTLATLQTSSSAITGRLGNISYGVIRTFDASNMYMYQPAALTVQSPAHFDGSEIDSSAIGQYRDADGNRIAHSFADFQRGAIQSSAHDEIINGTTVLDIVASTDTEITNAVPGQRYLIDDTTSLDGYVFWMLPDGPKWYPPKLNDIITDLTSSTHYKHNGTAWVAIGILTATNHTDLTDTGDTTLHYHASDRNRVNHTGTQTASTVSDFNEAAQDAIGAMVSNQFTYTDATPLLALNFTNIPHNSMASKQGGTTSEYYHLTSANHSALTGGVSTSVPHGHRSTSRTVTVSGDILASDENNIIYVPDTITGAVTLTPSAGLLAISNARFSIVVDHNATYAVKVYISGSQSWLLDNATGIGIWRYNFTVISGVAIPDSAPTYDVA
jgi:hypothetical protein